MSKIVLDGGSCPFSYINNLQVIDNLMSKYSFDIDHHLEKAAKGEILSEAAVKVVCAKVKEILS